MPVHGAKGIYRAAGPLPQDVNTAMNEVKGRLETKPQTREKLNTKAVGIKGAKESLKARLQKLENEEKNMASPPRPGEAAKASTDATMLAEMQKKSPKRDNEKSPEKSEAESWEQVRE